MFAQLKVATITVLVVGLLSILIEVQHVTKQNFKQIQIQILEITQFCR